MSSEGDSSRNPADPYEHADDAVDDSANDDADFVALQRRISQRRRETRDTSNESPIQRILPFPFAPNIRPLTISDLESCVALENAAFTKLEHRASPEKLEYRLTKAPELSIGVFCTVVPDQANDFDLETLPTARPVETDRENNAVSVLLAHIVSTRSFSPSVKDSDMDFPRDWKTGSPAEVGHQEGGRTAAVHSLAVAPKLHGRGLGKLIMKSYLQQMNNSGTVDRVALLCQDYLVSYYERFGFKHAGESKAEAAGGGWHDMFIDLAGPPKITI